jgi:hypothetical protein
MDEDIEYDSKMFSSPTHEVIRKQNKRSCSYLGIGERDVFETPIKLSNTVAAHQYR